MRKILFLAATLLFCIASASITSAQSLDDSTQNTIINAFAGNWSKPVVEDGFMFVASTQSVYCINATDGFKLWNINTDSTHGNFVSIPVYDNGFCYVVSNGSHLDDQPDGWLWVIDVNTGLPVCTIGIDNQLKGIIPGQYNHTLNLNIKIESTSLVVGDVVYETLTNGTVTATFKNQIQFTVNLIGANSADKNFGVPIGSTVQEKQALAKSTASPTVIPEVENNTEETSSPVPSNNTTNIKAFSEITSDNAPVVNSFFGLEMKEEDSNIAWMIFAGVIVAIGISTASIVLTLKQKKLSAKPTAK